MELGEEEKGYKVVSTIANVFCILTTYWLYLLPSRAYTHSFIHLIILVNVYWAHMRWQAPKYFHKSTNTNRAHHTQ